MELDIVPRSHPDYLDNLLPGYRFCPTDQELILYYLKRQIETGERPASRIHEVNLYNYSPEQLTTEYRPCDDKWYFLTSRERKYQKGDVPNRRTRDFGFWKMTQKFTKVYRDETRREVIGRKGSLAFYDEKGCKTSWLMHEYTMDDPNFPVGSRKNDKKVLTDWVLCTIYKKKNSNKMEAPNHQVSIATNILQFSINNPHNPDSLSIDVSVAQPNAYTSPVTSVEHMAPPLNTASRDITNKQTYQMIEPLAARAPVSSSEDVPMDDGGDHMFQMDDLISKTWSVVDDDGDFDFDLDVFSLDELLGPEFRV
ncbi:hypothetical protein SSX86_015610 [Deinandra increscens subsp. villosa]|uniref:NAC domain-containing protein n=1 Tax=Deinandra increscens subsp. villosa TaxID=3103831 RepID=A0AAP0GZ78_9ASTR